MSTPSPAAPATAPASAPTRPPVALTVAGTDPTGGAGVQADLKTFTVLGTYGTSVITALVAQNTHGVDRMYDIEPDFVAAQFDSVLTDIPVDATKTGMLSTRPMVELVAKRARTGDLGFLVVDPVMVATSGHRLLHEDAIDAVRTQIVPAASIITPNLPEAALLLGDDVEPATTQAYMIDQARELIDRGCNGVLLKGGHGTAEDVPDILALADGTVEEFHHRRIHTPNTHGTGCTLSAAIAALAAQQLRAGCLSIAEVVATSLDYLALALESGKEWTLPLNPEGAHGPVDHMAPLSASGVVPTHTEGKGKE